MRNERAWHALSLLLVICTSVQASTTERAPETFSLSLARQPLDGALQELARQCGVQVIFFARVTEGLNAPAIEGDYTLAAAMDRLLAGSGLTSRVINPQTVEVRPLQARATDPSRSPEIPATSQTRQSSNTPAAPPPEEVVIVGLAEQLVATRIATPLQEIPQAVSIVTHEQMRQRNEFTLADVLEDVPGITRVRANSLDQDFYARAYPITSFHIDGGAAVNPKFDPSGQSLALFLGTPDLVEFDHVEILRGADALFSGNANPGGTISLVRKRPQPNFGLELNAAGGSWGNQRIELDLTGPIARDGALRGRVAAVYARDGYFYDIPAHQKKKIFGAFEYDLTDSATLTAGASFQWDDASGVGTGLPLYADGRDAHLPRDTALEFDWTRYRSNLGGVYLQYRQQLAPQWALRFNASGWRNKAEFAYGSFSGTIDPLTNEVGTSPLENFSARPNVHTQKTADLTLTGTLDWFGWREEVAIGGDFTRLEFRADNEGYVPFGTPLGDPRVFDPRDFPDPRPGGPPDYGIATNATSEQHGMFASLRIYFDDAWSVVGGARVSGDSMNAQITVQNSLVPGEQVVSLKSGTNDVVTPYAGVMYALDRHYSLYASYADIYLSQDRLRERAPGNLLGPQRGVNIEAGLKSEWRDGALNGSLALYQIEQSNVPVVLSSRKIIPGAPACCYGGVSNRSRGVDAELSGELMPGWNIGAGYTYNLNESPGNKPLSTSTPKHLLKAWLNARLPAAFNRWQIGGRLHAQSETMTSAAQRAYAVLDLRTGFDVDRHWRVALSLNNVLDKVYYESIDTPIPLHAWYGEPRNWMLRIDGRY